MNEDLNAMEHMKQTAQTQEPKNEIIPVNLMVISGNSDTKTEHRLSYSQIVFLREEQWPTFTMRLNDLITTLNQMADDNSREKHTP